jgi:hypothetical protein
MKNTDICQRARTRALSVIASQVINGRQLHAVLDARVEALFDGSRDFDSALAELEADGESAGGARRLILCDIHQQLTSPLWLLEASCESSRH